MPDEPFQDQMRDNFCWGCGADNPSGLQLKSRWQDDMAVARWHPSPEHAAGPRHLLNGGVIATLLDCHAVGTAIADAYRSEGRSMRTDPEIWCATASMTIDYLRPTPLDGAVDLTAQVVARDDRSTTLECVLSAESKERARADGPRGSGSQRMATPRDFCARSVGAHRVIEASAPVRICDNGGWTDTWFGGPGRVLNIAVTPGVNVSIRATTGDDPVVLDVDAFGHRYPIVPGATRVPRRSLLEAAIDARPPPKDRAVEIIVRSVVPAGSGVGTSAAVTVALLGALTMARSEPLSRREIAYAAHRLEVDVLGQESGIQDQLSAAFGGISYLEIDAFPEAVVQTLPDWSELGPRLTLVFLGHPHDSSAVHREVIESVGGRGSAAFASLRDAAVAARAAVLAQDLGAFGTAMIANTNAQSSLHAALVGRDARQVIDVADALGAIGWKVNGAGGEGGSVTLLSASPEARRELEHCVAALDARYEVPAIETSSSGLAVHGDLAR